MWSTSRVRAVLMAAAISTLGCQSILDIPDGKAAQSGGGGAGGAEPAGGSGGGGGPPLAHICSAQYQTGLGADAEKVEAHNVLVDPIDERFLLVGSFAGTLFDSGQEGPITSVNGQDGLMAWFNETLAPQRYFQVGGQGRQEIRDAMINASGDVAIGGAGQNNIDIFGSGIDVGAATASFGALVRRDDWLVEWARGFGGLAVNAVVTKNARSTFGGVFDKALSFEPSTPTVQDAFVVTWGEDDMLDWHYVGGGAEIDRVLDMTAVGSTELAVVGDYDAEIVFDTTILSSAGTRNAFFARFAIDNGAELSALAFGSSDGAQSFHGVAEAGNGSVVVVGHASGTVAYDPPREIAAVNGRAAVVVKYDALNAYEWVKMFADDDPGANKVEARGVAVDTARERIYVVGSAEGTVDFGGGWVLQTGFEEAPDAFIAVLDFAGETLDVLTFPNEGAQFAFSVAVLEHRVVMAGNYQGTPQFGEAMGTVTDVAITADPSGDTVHAFVVSLSCP